MKHIIILLLLFTIYCRTEWGEWDRVGELLRIEDNYLVINEPFFEQNDPSYGGTYLELKWIYKIKRIS